MKILLLSGSFHQQSRSLAILEVVQSLLTEHECTLPQLAKLPFYNEDLNPDKPQEVIHLLAAVNACDGIIVCTPEYNHSIPAVLKNAIDWASRPAFKSPLKHKPVSIITQAPSPVGGARAQAHLKLVFDSTLCHLHPCHEMMIPQVDQIFDGHMKLVDNKVQQRLARHLDSFINYIAMLKSAESRVQ